jgi:hypothetical protein
MGQPHALPSVQAPASMHWPARSCTPQCHLRRAAALPLPVRSWWPSPSVATLSATIDQLVAAAARLATRDAGQEEIKAKITPATASWPVTRGLGCRSRPRTACGAKQTFRTIPVTSWQREGGCLAWTDTLSVNAGQAHLKCGTGSKAGLTLRCWQRATKLPCSSLVIFVPRN